MKRSLATLFVTVLLFMPGGITNAWEETPPLRINYVAYPVIWNGQTIMIAARLQIPLEANGKLPAVILMHGTSDRKSVV